MTALTVPVPSAKRRPVPWTRLAWVTWRQHRVALAGAAILLGGLSLYLLIAGLKARAAMTSLGLNACHPVTVARCATQLQIFQNEGYYSPAPTISGLLQVVPVLIGVFAGAPLLARELETGTFRFSWTQGCGRTRWAIGKLALLAAALTAAAAAFSLLFSWYYQPFFAQRLDGVLAPQLFDLRGVAFAAWTLAAFAIGVFAGVVIRRVVPALAAGLAVWTGLDLATALFLRGHYQAPVTTPTFPLRVGDSIPWVLRSWWTGPDGHVMSSRAIFGVLGQMKTAVGPRGSNGAAVRWLAQRHYIQWTTYQPESRFWHFQLIEGGWLLALSLVLFAATVWLVRRRAA
ncbi:MAG TPA: ABC transporter permease subunit [Streptosporangiaceae bacterium]|nr:ABC transporter permease subunit [Streptosporangiaceae bacterium]